jgi:hypothetical protein
MVNDALEEKLRDAGTLFEAQILLRCRAADRARAKSTMQLLLGAFEPFTAQNWLRARGLSLGFAFLGSDLPLRRARFDRRMDIGLFAPPKKAVLTASEMAGFLKPPSVHCHGDNVARAGMLLAAAPKLPEFKPDRADVIPLGKVGTNGSEHVLGVRAADTYFSYIAGRSRYGKTELAIAQFVHLVRTGHGGFFLDPTATPWSGSAPTWAIRSCVSGWWKSTSAPAMPPRSPAGISSSSAARTEGRSGSPHWSTPSPRCSNGASARRGRST